MRGDARIGGEQIGERAALGRGGLGRVVDHVVRVGTTERISAEAARTSWQSFGLRFCGIVELPTVPGGTGSSTSANSVFIRV